MTVLETGIVTYLKAQSVAGGRIYPVKIPQTPTAYPLITYQRISTVADYTHSGKSNIEAVRIQFRVWHEEYGDAKEAAEDLKDVLEAYSGSMGAVDVGVALKANEIDLPDPESGLHSVIIDMIIRRQ